MQPRRLWGATPEEPPEEPPAPVEQHSTRAEASRALGPLRRRGVVVAVLVVLAIAVGVTLVVTTGGDDGPGESAVEPPAEPPPDTGVDDEAGPAAPEVEEPAAPDAPDAPAAPDAPTPTAPSVAEPPPTSAPVPLLPGFGPGTQEVGVDVAPGLYTTGAVTECSWSRRSELDGDEGVIAAGTTEGRALVQIAESDFAFSSVGCGDWTLAVFPVLGAPRSEVGDGAWRVGIDIEAGRWSSSRDATGCYWERLSGFGGDPDERVTFGVVDGGITIDIIESDVGFASSGCGTWERTG